MKSKVILKIEHEVIKKAKLYAQQKNISLSDLVESILIKLTDAEYDLRSDNTPIVKNLSGIIQPVPANIKKVYRAHLKSMYVE
ncbi:MAG: DUF6364 family protein [Bacteroidota bacterium]|nr:DUF6364 family protein [Bacteroidota bacterium]